MMFDGDDGATAAHSTFYYRAAPRSIILFWYLISRISRFDFWRVLRVTPARRSVESHMQMKTEYRELRRSM